MRIWSLHPTYLDRQGLIACWRETLLAQAVIAGRTKGYRNHPQLDRFRAAPEPLAAIGCYLHKLADEADLRGYRFDRSRIVAPPTPTGVEAIEVTLGQLDLERRHLLAKLAVRTPEAATLPEVVEPHPLFRVVPGGVAEWERAR